MDGAIATDTDAGPAGAADSDDATDCAGQATGDCTGQAGGDRAGRAAGQAWDANDWEQPASVFRPDPRTDLAPAHPDGTAPPETPLPTTGSRSATYPAGSTRITPCPGGGHPRPLPVTIGIIVTAPSLFGFSNTPGQLMDRSAPVIADRVRELAQQKGTLFYRLLTDDNGNLLDVTELGRFPSRKLANAVKFRDGTCTGPTCTVPATRSDLDHIIPVPDGPTTAENLDDKCRNDHRAKTHGGHHTARTGPHTTKWTTPTGHTYTHTDMPFPVETWPTDDDKQQE